MGQKDGEKWTAAVDSQPTLPESDRLLDDADLQRQLDAALQGFDEAAIFTIHGFCQRALADTPFAAQMPMQQTLLRDDRELLQQAVNDVWRQRVAAADADPWLTAFLLAQRDSPERWAKLLKRHLARPLALQRWPSDIDQPSDGSAQAAALAASFDQARALWAAQGEAALAELYKGLKRLNANSYNADSVQTATAGWQQLVTLAQPPAPGDTLPDKLALLGTALLQKRAKKDQAPPAHACFDAIQGWLDALEQSGRALRLARLRLLRSLLDDGARALRQNKRAQRVVAFDDMLFNLYERLHGDAAPGLAAALLARFPAALIDEFQDTDPLQLAVFQAIYRAAVPTAGETAPPLFLVGDPKQAIYSFRHADLHTYLQAKSQADHCHTLLANQRATGALIEAQNRLFGRQPQAFIQPGLAYHSVALGAKPRPLLQDNSAPRAALQVWTLPADPHSGLAPLKPQAKLLAAEVCAGEIARLLQAAADGLVKLDQRPLRAGDIAVLVRSHQQGSVMRQALAALGVASVELSLASVFHSPDAEELERVLAAMLEPSREGLLKAALATRLLGGDAASIAALADDEAALAEQMQRLGSAHLTWRQRGVGFMLRQWLHGEQVPARLLAQADGARRLTNLLHLAECLHQAEREHAAPEALLRWLQAQRDDPSGDESTQLRLESDRNLVQIVTIHKSKGLEYPLVFCPFLWDGRLGAGDDGLDGISRHDEQGRAVLDFRAGLDADFDEAAARDEARMAAAAEFMRLVYVALTRAVHRCTLVAGAYLNKSGKGISSKESGRALLNWLVAGEGLSPADWLSLRRTPADPAQLDAAWAALADGTAANSLAVSVLPAAHRQVLSPASGDPARLQALPPPAQRGEAWWIASYSSLIQGVAEGARPADAEPAQAIAADHDLRAELSGADTSPAEAEPGAGLLLVAPSTPAAAAGPPRAADDFLDFPRGAAAGECVHAVFEWADFSDPASWAPAIDRALRRHPPAATDASTSQTQRWAAMLGRLLAEVLDQPLALGTAQPLRLSQLGLQRRLVELEFHLPATRLDARRLKRCLKALGYDAPGLVFATLQGYLKGFIDLVFEHQGRYFIADWKSNHLGEAAADYGPTGLAAAMRAHHYPLQYLIYSVALHRWLARRLPDYHYAQHFGGAVYLFVRGVRPDWRLADGQPCGVVFDRPPQAAIEQLSALLAGGELEP